MIQRICLYEALSCVGAFEALSISDFLFQQILGASREAPLLLQSILSENVYNFVSRLSYSSSVYFGRTAAGLKSITNDT